MKKIAHALYLNSIKDSAIGGDVRHTNDRSLPRNQINAIETNCFKSFRNIKRADFQVTHHVVNQNFGKLIEPIFGTPGEVDPLATVMSKLWKSLQKKKNI